MIFLDHKYNIQDRRWEFELIVDGKYVSPGYLNPNRSEAEKYSDLVGWLNKCFRIINDESYKTSQ